MNKGVVGESGKTWVVFSKESKHDSFISKHFASSNSLCKAKDSKELIEEEKESPKGCVW